MDFLAILLPLLLCYTFIKVLLSLTGAGKPNNLPPGPAPLPIIGNLHLLGNQPHQSLAKLAEIYGPVMSLKLGRITTLVISSAAAAKEVMQKQDVAFSHRYVPDALHAHNHSQYSVGWLPVDTQWRSLRKILNTTIFSGKRLDNGANQRLRRRKVEELVAYCQKASLANDPVNIGRAAFRTTLNLLSNTIFSKDLTDPYQDSGKEFKELVVNIMVEAGKPNLVDFFPALKKIDPQGIRRRLTYYFGKVLEIFEGLINERLEMRRLKEGKGENDDALEIFMDVSQRSPEEINRNHIKSMFLDLFAAGTDTTSSTIEWAMTELIRNPHIMAKVKKELEQVIGKGKILENNDILNLPYLRCIMKETLRIHPPVPLLLPRQVNTQVMINDYIIPKGTQVFVNAWAIGRDSTLWEDPLTFKPERFLTSGLDVWGQDFELIPFGAGRRICPGLPLAVRMIPVMLGSLLNNFDWKLESDIGPDELDMTEKFGLTLQKADPLRVIPLPLN